MIKKKSCCTANQTQFLARNFPLIEDIVGKCPACVTNLENLWCAFICHDGQKTYQTVTNYIVKNNVRFIKDLIWRIHPDTATKIYNSCKDVIISGMRLEYIYPNYESLFQMMGTSPTNIIKVQFEFPRDGLVLEPILGCRGSCPCSQCIASCPIDENRK